MLSEVLQLLRSCLVKLVSLGLIFMDHFMLVSFLVVDTYSVCSFICTFQMGFRFNYSVS